VRARLHRWLGDPLVHFVALGALVLGTHHLLAPPASDTSDDRVIAVEDRYVEALVEERAARTGRDPAALDRDEARRGYVREEALVREARALGLDAGDAIVRRRLVQKMELLVRASVEVPEPTDDELTAFLAAHADEHVAPADVSFELRFFSRDRRGAQALEDAQRAHDFPDDPASAGDPFPLGGVFEHRTYAAAQEMLGAEILPALEHGAPGTWSEPIEARHGVELVRVTERTPARPRTLEELRPALRAQWIDEAEARAVDEALDAIVQSYRVERVP
jgi:hypothetical protein